MNPLVCPLEFETLQLSAPTGDPERLTEPEQVTNEVMTEDLETRHGDDVTDDSVLPDSKAEDELYRAGDGTKPLPPYSYDRLGNLSYHPCSASSIQVPTANIVPDHCG